MDHFPAIKNPAYPNIRVPLLGSQDKRYIYDHKGFYGYPERAGFDVSVLRRRRIPEGKSSEDTASFLQAWLFFGLFEEFFQFSWMIECNNSTKPLQDILTKTDENGQNIICTKALTHILPMWVDQQVALEKDFLDKDIDVNIHSHRQRFATTIQRRLSKIDHLLSEAGQYVRTILFKDGQFSKLMPPDVCLSIAILGETLSFTRNLAYVIAPESEQRVVWTPLALALGLGPLWESELLMKSLDLPESLGSMTFTRWGEVSCLAQRLQERGFCRSEINFFQGYTISSAYFASRIPRVRKGNHVECTDTKCIAYQVTSEYQPMHVHGNYCDPLLCPFIEAETDKLSSLLRRGATPVISVCSMENDSQELMIDIKSSTLVKQYVAISHVWSDGLGNPDSNAMYRCQLLNIQKMVNLLGVMIGSSKPVHFWIDTLCIPVHDVQDRRCALNNMARYYSDASCVLVLDADLMACSTAISSNEFLMRMCLSTWMRRLWTLQEGILAKELWAPVRGGISSINRLVSSFSCQQSVADIYAYAPCVTFGIIAKTTDKTELLLNISIIAHRRSTSKTDDESICLAHLLGLDVGPIIGLTHSKRMEKIWASLQKIPLSVLRLRCPRLSTPGFRWAPETLIHASEIIKSTQALADRVDSGLMFRSPGYLFSDSMLDLSEDNLFIALDNPRSIYLLDHEPVPVKVENPILLIPDPDYVEYHQFLDECLPHCERKHCVIASFVRCMQKPDYIEVHHELDTYMMSLEQSGTSNKRIMIPPTLNLRLLTARVGNTEDNPMWLLT